MRLPLFFIFCLLLLAAGCSGSQGDLKGPPEDPLLEQSEGDSLPSLLPANSEDNAPADAAIASLVANPSAFEGRLLQVEGLFKSSLEEICPDKRFGAPASWALTDGQESIAAAGLENLAAALPDGQITLLVEGAWRSWPIPANCRQEGDPSELYYLEVVQVISPNPIALAPGSVSGAPAPQQTAGGGIAGDPLPTAGQQGSIPTATVMAGLEVPPQGTINSGAYPPPATTPMSGSGSYPAPVGQPPVTPGSYPGPAGQTPVPEQPAPVPAAEVPLDRDLLSAGSLETGTLGLNNSERWRYIITATQTIDLQIVPDAGLELIVTVMDHNGQVVSANTTTSPGQKVTLAAVNLPQAGEYAILLTTLENGSGNYAILLSDEDTYNFLFRENLVDGVAHTGDLLPENDHFYFFSGTAGEVVDLTARPLDNADLFLRLFDPSGITLFSFHDENSAGQAEQISTYSLPETGLYSLLIGEQAFAGGAYEVVLDRR
jgi:hypothetical protein